MNIKQYIRTGLLVSTVYAVAESIYRYPKGETTTIEQFLMNFVTTPFLIHGLEYTIKYPEFRLFIFPLAVWLLEIIQGSFFLYFFDYRVWFYDDAYSFFDGHISLSFVLEWWFLGILAYLVYWV